MNKKIYLTGLVLFCFVASGLLYHLGVSSRALYLESEAAIQNLQKKRQSISAMEVAARERSYILVQMFNEEDYFKRDQLRQAFDNRASQFKKNRVIFLSAQLSASESSEITMALKLVGLTEVYDTTAADYMMADNMDAAEKVLFGAAVPSLYKVIEKFGLLLDLVDNEGQLVLVELQSQLKNNLYIMFILTSLFVFSAVILTLLMFSRMKKDAALLTGSEALKDSILDTAMDAILSVDKNGIVSRFNKSAEHMFGYSAEEMKGHSIEKILIENFKSKLEELKAAEKKHKSKSLSGISHEVNGLHKEGAALPLQISMSDTGIIGSTKYSLIIRDLTEIKKSDEALRQRTEELEYAKAKYKQLSETDPLTQIANRRVYEERVNNEINIAKRTGSSLSLLMIDVDFFKNYNDKYGHDSGDVALIRVAKTILESLPRSTDLAVRFGGEEFIVLMPLTGIDGALKVSERIKFNVKALAISHSRSNVASVITVSIGLTSMKGDLLNESDLLKQADMALYSAKGAGRNQCKVYSENN
jgi:diguanylate cyclase (GGDEF)-like protein/PAS domain S-box-containing protein